MCARLGHIGDVRGVQVTTGTVDEGIHAMAARKTRLDAAVLDGITASSDSRKGAAAETLQARAQEALLGRMAVPFLRMHRPVRAVCDCGGQKQEQDVCSSCSWTTVQG